MSNKRFSILSLMLSVLLTSAVAAAESGWTTTSTGSTASLRAIVAVNDLNVWASGTNGTVLHTLDGGVHWTKIRGLPDDLDFRGLQTPDGRTVLVMSAGSGLQSRIYRSKDAGEHWTLVHQNRIAEAFFDDIAFYDVLRGLVVGDPVDGTFFLLATSDGGATWKRLAGPTAQVEEGAFAASNSSLTVNRSGAAWFGTGGVFGGRVYRSWDTGRTWAAASSMIRHDSPSAGVFSLAFRDPKHGYAVGGDYKKLSDAESVFAETNDGGLSWHELHGPTGFRSAIAIHDQHMFTTGPSGSEFRLAGKGRKWKPITGEGFHALAISPKGRLVWACGSNGRIGYFRFR
jgi:photosystem II stability/assembly factor-like uncharacterized protein